MDERDKELEQLLEPLRGEPISPFYLRRWRIALERTQPTWYRWTVKGTQFAVATAAGFALGIYVSGSKVSETFSVADATVEQVFAKAE